jgi:hypothetical protein
MSDNIAKMTDKQLRNEVQLLRDELAKMKRQYEDIIYNLDTDNFSSRFTREQKDMKAAIEFTAEGIKTKVSKEEMETFRESTITQTATQIKAAVESVTNETDKKLEQYATVKITDDKISASVKETKEYAEGYVTDVLANGDYVTNATFETQFDIYANGIYSTVEETYETKNDANSSYNSLRSSISQTADRIETRVEDLENFKTSVFTQKSEGFYLDGDVTKFTGVLYLTDDSFNDKASIYYGDGSDDMNQEYIAFWPVDYSMPMVFGYNPEKVYISSIADGNQIATRKWVLDNAGIDGTVVAVFG